MSRIFFLSMCDVRINTDPSSSKNKKKQKQKKQKKLGLNKGARAGNHIMFLIRHRPCYLYSEV